MPIYIRTLGYKVYFWSNENNEPIHFHITKGNPSENDTKVWVLANGSFKIAHNKGQISSKDLSRIFSAMQSYYFDFLNFWKTYHNSDIRFYN
jgi:hypothetical protein